jgi:CrcB protein
VKTFLAVCLGGAVGTGARFLVQAGSVRWLGGGFPHGTLAVNLVGSFLLGAVAQAALRGAMSQELRVVVATGILGGFTTYSSFSQEMLGGLQRGAWGWSLLYAVLTLTGGLAAGAAGTWLGR